MIFIQLSKYHATFKILFNFVKYIMQLSKYGATFRNISYSSGRMYIFGGTCIMTSEQPWDDLSWQPIEDIVCTMEPPQLINQRSQFQFTQSDLNNIKTMFKKVYFK